MGLTNPGARVTPITSPQPTFTPGRHPNDRGHADTQAADPASAIRRSQQAVRVLFIGGEGRSGSTILSTMLGNFEGFLPVGELPVIWHALQTNELCGCEQPFASCTFWRAVGNVAFGGWSSVDVEEVLHQQARFTRHRRIAELILQSHEHFPDPSFRAYCERLGQVYHAIREVSGCSVIVDSTKSPPSAMLLRKVPHIDLRVVHLVRDSRGVAFSWNKSDIENIQYREHPILKGRPMPTMRPSESALWWDIKNLLLHAFIPIDQRLLVHYERLTSKPTEELRRILHFVDVNEMPTSTKINLGTTFTSMPFHTLGGNPLRFPRGNIDVHVDTTWRARMPLAQKAIVSGLTFPLLRGVWLLRRTVGTIARYHVKSMSSKSTESGPTTKVTAVDGLPPRGAADQCTSAI